MMAEQERRIWEVRDWEEQAKWYWPKGDRFCWQLWMVYLYQEEETCAICGKEQVDLKLQFLEDLLFEFNEMENEDLDEILRKNIYALYNTFSEKLYEIKASLENSKKGEEIRVCTIANFTAHKLEIELLSHPEYINYLKTKEKLRILKKKESRKISENFGLEEQAFTVKEIYLRKLENQRLEYEQKIQQISNNHKKNICVYEQKIEFLSGELQKLGWKQEDRKEFMDGYQKTLVNPQSPIANLDHEQLGYLYKAYFNEEKSFNCHTGLDLDLTDDQHLKMFKMLQTHKLPSLCSLRIDKLPADVDDMKAFLENSMPPTLKSFGFNFKSDKMISIGPYLESLTHGLKSTKFSNHFSIRHCSMTGSQLCSLLSSIQHCSHINIELCQITSSSTLSFPSLNSASFTSLNFYQSGSEEFSDWQNYPERLMGILKGLGKVEQVRRCLKEIGLSACGVSEEEVLGVLEEAGLKHVKVVM